MSCNAGVVAGPEVDMADLDCASSSSSYVLGALDLNLNLGPLPAPRDGLALQLAIGGHNSEGPAQVSRQSWPRFEPGMSGLPLACGQEDDGLASPEVRPWHVNMRWLDLMPQEIDQSEQGAIPSRVPAQESVSGHHEFEPLVSDRYHEETPNVLLTQRMSRNSRHTRRLRRSAQVLLTSALERAEMRSSSASGSTAEVRIVGTSGARPTSPICRSSEICRSLTKTVDLTSAAGGLSSTESTNEDTKETETGHVGAHFECNICLEMASEPVVTCCGHLFCWPCLYQWLHVHSSLKECPVCKGSLSDDVIIPIYGRGTVKVTEKSVSNIPPRPHAHCLNSKGFQQERVTQERLDRDVRMAGGGGRSEVVIERSESERSNSTALILNRLRVAQRLQLEQRLRQRMMRRATFQSPPTNGAMANSTLNPGQGATQYFEQHNREQMLTRVAINRLETADSLAVIQARLDGLRENLASMQRSVQITNFLPGLVGASVTQEDINCRIPDSVEPVVGAERMLPTSGAVYVQGLSTNADVQLQQDLAEMQRASWQALHRASSGSSGSFDLEPDLLHTRKRRRLN